MIKKFLLGLITIIGLGLSFSNAGKIGYIGESETSIYSSDYTILVNGKGNLLTQYFGLGKRLLQFNKGNYFFRSTNSKPYMYVSSVVNGELKNPFQGYVQSYFLCDFIGLDSGSAYPSNCIKYSIDDGDYNSVIRIIGSLNNDGYFYYNSYGCSNSYGKYQQSLDVCFSSSQFNRSVCFYGGTPQNFENGYSCGGSHGLAGNFYTYQGGENKYASNLSGSLGISAFFDQIDSSYLGGSPAGYGGSSEGSSQGVIDSTITGDYVYADCTWNDILIALESEGYNKYVCYGGLDNFDLYDSSINYNPIPGTGLSISQIWAWNGSRAWDSFPEWFIFWNGLYKDTSDNNYNAMWESYPAVYRTYFQLFNTYKGSVLDPRTVLEYCQLRTLTGDQLNNTAGGYFKPVCETIIREKQTGIWNSRLDGTIYSGGIYTGDVPIGVNWNGVGNMSGVTAQSDGLNFIQNFFNLAKSNLLTNYSGSPFGILPNYIVIFLIALILFRFISH